MPGSGAFPDASRPPTMITEPVEIVSTSSSARGAIEGTAMVTNRMPTLKIDGKDIWHIGFPIHWGYAAAKGHEGPLANFLTPSVGDPNTWTPEYKAFLVNLEKA